MNPLQLDLPKDYRVNLLKALTSQDVNKLRPVIHILVLLNLKGEVLGLLRPLRDIATSITGQAFERLLVSLVPVFCSRAF